MPNRSSKPKDVNQLAASVTQDATEEPHNTTALETSSEKNPAAIALGRLGGLKGGKARARKLSAKKRREIAKKAAKARWSKQSKPR